MSDTRISGKIIDLTRFQQSIPLLVHRLPSISLWWWALPVNNEGTLQVKQPPQTPRRFKMWMQQRPSRAMQDRKQRGSQLSKWRYPRVGLRIGPSFMYAMFYYPLTYEVGLRDNRVWCLRIWIGVLRPVHRNRVFKLRSWLLRESIWRWYGCGRRRGSLRRWNRAQGRGRESCVMFITLCSLHLRCRDLMGGQRERSWS